MVRGLRKRRNGIDRLAAERAGRQRIPISRVPCRRRRSLAALADRNPRRSFAAAAAGAATSAGGKIQIEFDDRLQTAKLDSLKEFAYGAGHELNNPLANIASRAQTLLREETQPDRRRRLAAINTQAFRAHEMLADMMLFARPPRLAPEPVDLVRLADEVLAELAEDAAAQQTTLHPPGRREPLMITADPVQLRVALRAMCVNSLEALGRAGNVTIEVASPNDGYAEVTITDDGPGISSEIREKIFDPFFSGREAGRGLGFGLSKAWRIVTLHGGQIVVHSQSGRGASFTIMLPTNSPQLSQQQATS